jgi:SWI/SNF-related matrix-associated actin-dependent regulator 1 of chromatin subfamily A
MTEFRPYQIEAGERMAATGRFLLADAPRVGKTAAAIFACEQVGAESILWVTTGSARVDHARAWERFAGRKANVIMKGTDAVQPGQLNIISYDLAAKRAAELMKHDWDAGVLDEMHKLKARDSGRTVAILGHFSRVVTPGIVSKCKHVFALSGTPAPNNYAELWPFLRAVLPETITGVNGKPVGYWDFAQRYTIIKDNGFGLKIEGSRNGQELKGRISKFTMRRTLADIAPDVPRLTSDIVELGSIESVKVLKTAEQDAALRTIGPAFDRMTHDQQDKLLAHVAKVADRKALRLTGLAKVPFVTDWLLDEMHDKLVIFAWHTEVLDELQAWMRKVKADHVRIDGSTPGQSRAGLVDKFQGDRNCRYFMGQILAAGEAIDLSAADEILFVESSWVPGQNEQACMRIVNVNKAVPTLARFATIKGSIDERVQKVAARKLGDIKGLFK